MADEAIIVRRPSVRTVAKWAGFTLVGIVLLLGAFLAWLNTDSGRRFIVGSPATVRKEIEDVAAERCCPRCAAEL